MIPKLEYLPYHIIYFLFHLVVFLDQIISKKWFNKKRTPNYFPHGDQTLNPKKS